MTTELDKFTYLARGNFNPIEGDSDTEDEEVRQHEDELVLKQTTVNFEGATVNLTDCYIAWEGNSQQGNSMEDTMTTHEIAFDDTFDPGYVYVSGFSTNQIARINIKNPTDQKLFRFEIEGYKFAAPHTIRFADEKGMLWVGLEYAGCIVKVDMASLLKKYADKGTKDGKAYVISEVDDIKSKLDVRISGSKNTIPRSINTHPHGFCFDKDHKNIWFTGKLTNTVGRVRIEDGDLKHFELPTIEAVPIYLALDIDGNVWGTCLANNNIFRVTTGAVVGQQEGCVIEIPVTTFAAQRRPITILRDPWEDRRYMWFSTEAGHSICRVDLNKMEDVFPTGGFNVNTQSSTTCMCSQGCRKTYKSPDKLKGIITEYPIPGDQNMIFGGMAFDRQGSIWVQSYYNVPNGIASAPIPSDYIIKIDNTILHKNRKELAGVPVAYFKVPSTKTFLHRIVQGPNEEMLFTELSANRFGTISIKYSEKKHNTYSLGHPTNAEPEPEPEPEPVEEVFPVAVKEQPPVTTNPGSRLMPLVQEETPTASPYVTPTPTPPSSLSFYRSSNAKVENVGNIRKKSKKRITWVFFEEQQEGLDSISHTVGMVWSKLSGKVLIEMDSVQILPEDEVLTKPGAPFVWHNWTDTQSGLRMQILVSLTTKSTMKGFEKYELTVNEKRFKSLVFRGDE